MDSVPCLFSHYHYTTYNIDCLDEFKKITPDYISRGSSGYFINSYSNNVGTISEL